ncbi:MAG: hypothetical protein ACREVN_08190 [Gammaproteobacteria bacterium]
MFRTDWMALPMLLTASLASAQPPSIEAITQASNRHDIEALEAMRGEADAPENYGRLMRPHT